MYAKDLSRKVKVAKRQRVYKGLFISAQTPYGYKIDSVDKKHLVVDEEVGSYLRLGGLLVQIVLFLELVEISGIEFLAIHVN